MDAEQFLSLSESDQAARRVALARAVLPGLAPWPEPARLAGDAVERSAAGLSGGASPDAVAFYLNQADPDESLDRMYDLIGDDADAADALDIVVFANGAAARLAFERGGRGDIPEPVEIATPDVVAEALAKHAALAARGRVPTEDR